MRKGPKPSAKRLPAEPLGLVAPRGMKGRAKAIYLSLVEDLAAEGYAARSDWRLVELAARTACDIEQIEAAIARLSSLVVAGSTGQEKVHPLVTELRAQRRDLASILAMLLLSPRARSASRMTEDLARSARDRSAGSGSEDEQRVLSLLG